MSFGSKAPPAPAATPLAPVMDQAAIAAATKKQTAADVARSGRLSTVLSQAPLLTDKLG